MAVSQAKKSERGVIMVIVAIGLMLFVGMAALGIDASRLFLVQTQLQTATDSAALAAVSKIADDRPGAIARAKDYALKNFANGVGVPLQTTDIEFGTWDVKTRTFKLVDASTRPDAVRVRGHLESGRSNPVIHAFAPALGIKTSNIVTTSIAAFGTGCWNIAVAQDVTASFQEEIGDARGADQVLLDCLQDHATKESFFGLAAFTGVGTTLSAPKQIGQDYTNLSNSISKLKNCDNPGMPKCSGTNIAAGIDQGRTMLTTLAPNPDCDNAIVLVTDGKPQGVSGYTTNQLEAMATASANAAAALNISVFAVFYDRDNDDDAANFLKTLIRKEGVFLRTPAAKKLPDLLYAICAKFPAKLVD